MFVRKERNNGLSNHWLTFQIRPTTELDQVKEEVSKSVSHPHTCQHPILWDRHLLPCRYINKELNCRKGHNSSPDTPVEGVDIPTGGFLHSPHMCFALNVLFC